MGWCFCCSVRVGFWDSCLLVLVGVVLGLRLFWFGLWFVGGLCFRGLVLQFLVCVSGFPACGFGSSWFVFLQHLRAVAGVFLLFCLRAGFPWLILNCWFGGFSIGLPVVWAV